MDINIPSQIVVKTAADWAVDNTVYSEKRILVTSNEYYGATDQRKYKIADGINSWANLEYFPVSGYDDASSSVQTQLDGKELLANKDTDPALSSNSDTLYPSQKAIKTYIERTISQTSTYMFTDIASSIGGTYKSMVPISSYSVGALATNTKTVTTAETLFLEFATDLGFPGINIIPAGLFICHYETQKASGANNYYTYFKVYKRALDNTETLLATSENTTVSNENTVIQNTISALITSYITLLSTDRIVIKIYGKMLLASASVSLFYDDNTNSRFQLPVPSIDLSGYELLANKDTDVTLSANSDTKYASQKAVKTYIDNLTGSTTGDLGVVISQTNTPAVGPTLGDRYLVGTAPTGTWIGNANNIAEWDGAVWQYTSPTTGNTVFINSTKNTLKWSGTAWITWSGTALLNNGNTVGNDISAGTNDAYSFYIKTNNVKNVRVGSGGNAHFKNSVIINDATLGTTPNASAYFEVLGTSKGILLPRLTTTQKNAVSTPATSLLVFDTTLNRYEFYDGASWLPVGGYPEWKLTGNAGTTAGTNFLGTTDAIDLVFKTNNTERMRVLSTGEVGIGVTPTCLLDVKGTTVSTGLTIVKFRPTSGVSNILYNDYGQFILTGDTGENQLQVTNTGAGSVSGVSITGKDLCQVLFGSTVYGEIARLYGNNDGMNMRHRGYFRLKSDSTNYTYVNTDISTGFALFTQPAASPATPTSQIDINPQYGYKQLRLRTTYSPSASSDTNGEIGDVAWDDNYLYLKTSIGWGRLPFESF